MHFKYWSWSKKIPENICQILIDEIKTQQPMEGTVYGENKNGHRKNKVVFLEKNHWFEGVLYNHIRYANQSASWNFNFDSCLPLQAAIYSPGERYDWHVDDDVEMREPSRYQDEFFKLRKLTAVCQLSKSPDFTGGGLFLKNGSESLIVEQGDLVVFPSYMEHKAEKVETGERITIVCWALGEYWK